MLVVYLIVDVTCGSLELAGGEVVVGVGMMQNLNRFVGLVRLLEFRLVTIIKEAVGLDLSSLWRTVQRM